MKKLLDRIWEWMKSTAWFQVVLLVGVVVAVVLSISPITHGISNAVSNAKRVKYYENNMINYDETISKINALDSGGEEFAVMFINPDDATSTDLQEGVQDYEDQAGAVKIYLINVEVNQDNKSKFDVDASWYDYYEVTGDMLTGFHNASVNVYDEWKYATTSDSNEVTQSEDYTATMTTVDTCVAVPSIVWFRASDNIDSDLRDMSTVLNPVTNENYDYHIAKVYVTIQDSSNSSDSTAIKTMSGLTKFFGTSIIG